MRNEGSPPERRLLQPAEAWGRKWMHGKVASAGVMPPNSQMIILVDADNWRALAMELDGEIRALLPEDKIRTGRYTDLLFFLADYPAVGRMITTHTTVQECTHRIRNLRIKGHIDETDTVIKLPGSVQRPEYEKLHKVFRRMKHFDVNGTELPYHDRKMPLHAKAEIWQTSSCEEHLVELHALYKRFQQDQNITPLLVFFGKPSDDRGERTSLLFATVEKLIPGPVYFLSKDGESPKLFEGRHTPGGRAIGVANLSGMLRAMLMSGYWVEGGAKLVGGDIGKTYLKLQYFINKGTNAKALYGADYEKNNVVKMQNAVDGRGSFIDGYRGLTLEERLSGKALCWDIETAQRNLNMRKGRFAQERRPEFDPRYRSGNGRTAS